MLLVPALSHPAEALGDLVWDFCLDTIGLCWLDFISPRRAGRGRGSWSLPALQGSHGCPTGRWHPGLGALGEDGHCMLVTAGHGITDYLKLEVTHEDHQVQLLGH